MRNLGLKSFELSFISRRSSSTLTGYCGGPTWGGLRPESTEEKLLDFALEKTLVKTLPFSKSVAEYLLEIIETRNILSWKDPHG